MEKSRTSPSVPLDLAVYMHKKEPFTWAFVLAFNFLQWKTGSSTHSAEEIATEAGMSETQIRRVAKNLCKINWYKKKRDGLKNSYEKLVPELSYRDVFKTQDTEPSVLVDQKNRPGRTEEVSLQDGSTINTSKEQEPAYNTTLAHAQALIIFTTAYKLRYSKKYIYAPRDFVNLKAFLRQGIDPAEFKYKAFGYVRSNGVFEQKCGHSFNYFLNGFQNWLLDFTEGGGTFSNAPTDKEVAL